MKTPRTLLPVLLALLLLLSQQLGYAHALSHWQDGSRHPSHSKQLPAEQSCAQCLNFAQLGSAPTTSAALPLASDLTYPLPVAAGVQPLVGATVFAFHSRAPPFTF